MLNAWVAAELSNSLQESISHAIRLEQPWSSCKLNAE